MGIVAIVLRIMPESPDSDLVGLQEEAGKILEFNGAKNLNFEIKEMAFGLKAIFIKFAWPEEKGSDVIEELLSKVKGVSSTSIEDYRRAFG